MIRRFSARSRQIQRLEEWRSYSIGINVTNNLNKKGKNCLKQQLTFKTAIIKIPILVAPLKLSSWCSLQKENIFTRPGIFIKGLWKLYEYMYFLFYLTEALSTNLIWNDALEHYCYIKLTLDYTVTWLVVKGC